MGHRTRIRCTRWWLVGACALGCGDDGPGDDEGTSTLTTMTSVATMTTDPTTGPTTSPTSTATEAESSGTSGPASCAGQPCGTNCEPEMCVEGDCSAYACNDDAQCVPHTGLVCQDQLEACMGHSCGDECFLPCNDDSDGACAATFCDPDGVCVEEALFEMRPCPGGTGTSGGSESGSSTG